MDAAQYNEKVGKAAGALYDLIVSFALLDVAGAIGIATHGVLKSSPEAAPLAEEMLSKRDFRQLFEASDTNPPAWSEKASGDPALIVSLASEMKDCLTEVRPEGKAVLLSLALEFLIHSCPAEEKTIRLYEEKGRSYIEDLLSGVASTMDEVGVSYPESAFKIVLRDLGVSMAVVRKASRRLFSEEVKVTAAAIGILMASVRPREEPERIEEASLVGKRIAQEANVEALHDEPNLEEPPLLRCSFVASELESILTPLSAVGRALVVSYALEALICRHPKREEEIRLWEQKGEDLFNLMAKQMWRNAN